MCEMCTFPVLVLISSWSASISVSVKFFKHSFSSSFKKHLASPVAILGCTCSVVSFSLPCWRYYLISGVFHRTFATVWLPNRGRLLLRTSDPMAFVLMLRPFIPEPVMSTDLLSFEHPSVLLFCLLLLYTWIICSRNPLCRYTCMPISTHRLKQVKTW